MPREETRHPFSEEEKGRILDTRHERVKYMAEIYFKFMNHKISVADLMRIPRKRLSKLAEVGYIKYKYGRYKDSLNIFKALSTVDSVNPYYHLALGGVYQKLGKFVDSVVCYTRAIRINPKELSGFVNRGEIYLKHKNFRKAADDFRNAILLDPHGKNLWANRARSLVIALKRGLEFQKRMEQVQRKPANSPSR